MKRVSTLCLFSFLGLFSIVQAELKTQYIHGDEVVLDTDTGKIWFPYMQKNVNLSEARSYCGELNLVTSGWSLPSAEELSDFLTKYQAQSVKPAGKYYDKYQWTHSYQNPPQVHGRIEYKTIQLNSSTGTLDFWSEEDSAKGGGLAVRCVNVNYTPPATSTGVVFDGTGSLVDPAGCDISGCNSDIVALHSHSQPSAGFFQVFRTLNVCESVELVGLDSGIVEVRSWSGRGADSQYYSVTSSSATIPLKKSSNWSLIAFKTNAPISSEKRVVATCLGSDSSNVSEISGTPMKFDNGYSWGGNGSLINHTNNQSDGDTQAGYGRDRDTAILLRDHKTLSVFQVTNTESCQKVRFEAPVSFNLSWKLWDEKEWRGSKTLGNNQTFTFPTDDYWWILKIETSETSQDNVRIDAVCE